MKKALLLSLILGSSVLVTSHAEVIQIGDIEIPPELRPTPPSCNSSEVRLSPKPIPCVPSLNDGKFEIPGAKLNIEDLKKIFQGAESSGGRIVNPMHVPRESTPIAPFPFQYECELKVLLDGNKRVSYLSKQEIMLTHFVYLHRPIASKWNHGLVLENSINAPIAAEIDTAPALGLDNLRVEVKFNLDSEELTLNACDESNTNNVSCASSKLSDEGADVTLYSELTSGKMQAKRTFMVSCRPR